MISEKLQLVSTGSNQIERTGSSQGVGEGEGSQNAVRWGESVRDDGKPIEQAYEELKEEYKVTFSDLYLCFHLYFLLFSLNSK